VRINAAARQHGLSYGQLIRGLKLAGVGLDRRNLAALAVDHPAAFEMLAKQAQAATPRAAARA
jgi:large subunit ribosomal protein L20